MAFTPRSPTDEYHFGKTLLRGLSSFWRTFFRDTPSLDAFTTAAGREIMGVQFEMANLALKLSIHETPVTNESKWDAYVLRPLEDLIDENFCGPGPFCTGGVLDDFGVPKTVATTVTDFDDPSGLSANNTILLAENMVASILRSDAVLSPCPISPSGNFNSIRVTQSQAATCPEVTAGSPSVDPLLWDGGGATVALGNTELLPPVMVFDEHIASTSPCCSAGLSTVCVGVPGDAIYFGKTDGIFDGLVVIQTEGHGGYGGVWEYWNGTAWIDISTITGDVTYQDDSSWDPFRTESAQIQPSPGAGEMGSGFVVGTQLYYGAFTRGPGTYSVKWNRPTDWAKNSIGASGTTPDAIAVNDLVSAYWVRHRVTRRDKGEGGQDFVVQDTLKGESVKLTYRTTYDPEQKNITPIKLSKAVFVDKNKSRNAVNTCVGLDGKVPLADVLGIRINLDTQFVPYLTAEVLNPESIFTSGIDYETRYDPDTGILLFFFKRGLIYQRDSDTGEILREVVEMVGKAKKLPKINSGIASRDRTKSSTNFLPTREIILIAPDSFQDLAELHKNLGYLVTDYRPSSKAFMDFVRGLWAIYVHGPIFKKVEAAVNLLAGIPVIEEDGIIASIDGGLITMQSGATITVPSFAADLGYVIKAGDVVEAFTPVAKLYEVIDNIKDPFWHKRVENQLVLPGHFVERCYEPLTVCDDNTTTLADVCGTKSFKPCNTKFTEAGGEVPLSFEMSEMYIDRFLKHNLFLIKVNLATFFQDTGQVDLVFEPTFFLTEMCPETQKIDESGNTTGCLQTGECDEIAKVARKKVKLQNGEIVTETTLVDPDEVVLTDSILFNTLTKDEFIRSFAPAHTYPIALLFWSPATTWGSTEFPVKRDAAGNPAVDEQYLHSYMNFGDYPFSRTVLSQASSGADFKIHSMNAVIGISAVLGGGQALGGQSADSGVGCPVLVNDVAVYGNIPSICSTYNGGVLQQRLGANIGPRPTFEDLSPDGSITIPSCTPPGCCDTEFLSNAEQVSISGTSSSGGSAISLSGYTILV